MGCGSSKNIQISNNLAFSNGKIVQKEGNYYLERTRYHDKLLPNVQKKFEVFLTKQVEDIGNKIQQEHEQKIQQQQSKKGRKSIKYGGRTTIGDKIVNSRRSESSQGTIERRGSMMTKVDNDKHSNPIEDSSQPVDLQKQGTKNSYSQALQLDFQKAESAKKAHDQGNEQDHSEEQKDPTLLLSTRRAPKTLEPLNKENTLKEVKKEEQEKEFVNLVVKQQTQGQKTMLSTKEQSFMLQDEKTDYTGNKTQAKKQSRQLFENKVQFINQFNSIEDRSINDQISKRILEQEQSIHKAVFSSETVVNTNVSNFHTAVQQKQQSKKMLQEKDVSLRTNKNIQSDDSVSDSDNDGGNSLILEEEEQPKHENNQFQQIIKDYKEIVQQDNSKQLSESDEFEQLNTNELMAANAKSYVTKVLNNVQ